MLQAKISCNEGDLGLIHGLGRSPGGSHGNTLQSSCLENPHGQRNLVGCSPWSSKESDTAERLSTAQGPINTLHYPESTSWCLRSENSLGRTFRRSSLCIKLFIFQKGKQTFKSPVYLIKYSEGQVCLSRSLLCLLTRFSFREGENQRKSKPKCGRIQ